MFASAFVYKPDVVARASERPPPAAARCSCEVAGATRRLPENLRFSLEAAGRRGVARAGPSAEAGEA